MLLGQRGTQLSYCCLSSITLYKIQFLHLHISVQASPYIFWKKDSQNSLTCLVEKLQKKPTADTRCAVALWVGRPNRCEKNSWNLEGNKAKMQGTSRSWLLESDEPPSLSAGVKHRKLLLYNSKSKRTFFPPCLCLCGWLQALSLFYGHMHAEGITARIFKGTATLLQPSGPTMVLDTASGLHFKIYGIQSQWLCVSAPIPSNLIIDVKDKMCTNVFISG